MPWMEGILMAVLLLGQAAAPEAKMPDAVKKAEAKLAESPDDPSSNLTFGRYLAFTRNDWDKALGCLVKGSDKTLAALAQKELDGAKTAVEKVGLGDDWVSGATKLPKDRVSLTERASKWYAEAWPELDDAWKFKLRDRLHKMASLPADYDRQVKGSQAPGGWVAFSEMNGSSLEERFGYSSRRSGKMMTWKDPNGPNSWITSSKFRIQAGKEYELNARIFAERADAPGELQLRFFDDASKSLTQVAPAVDPDLPLWKKYTGKVKAPEGATWADVCFWSRLKTGAFWIDEVSVQCEGKELLKNGGFEER